ncbi:MAG: glycosyltransferase family 39 protein [candidate division NC10 bacterium]|nr:glycosyltransferase family 39 protein [candidate division NC10 bacterium]
MASQQKLLRMEPILYAIVGLLLILTGVSHSQPKWLGFVYDPRLSEKVSESLSHVLTAYGLLFLGLALLSYALSLRGTSLLLTAANRSHQAAVELGRALSSSLRDHPPRGQEIAWLMAAFAVGLGIRGYFLAWPMRYDESETFLKFVNRGFLDLFYYPRPNNHVLHTLLVKLSTLLWGAHPVSIRFPALLSGMASLLLTFCLCRKLREERSGLLAITAMAVIPCMVFFSANARGYSLLVFLTLTLALMAAHVAEKPSLPGCGAASFIAALGMMTVPSMLFAVAGIYLWVACLFICKRRTLVTTLRQFVIPCTLMTLAFTLLLYTPSIVASGGLRPIVANRHLRSLHWQAFLHRIYPHLREVFSFLSSDLPPLVVVIGLVLLLVGVLGAIRGRNGGLAWLLPSMFLGAVIVFLLKHSIPPARIWIYLMPFLLVLADSGFTYLSKGLSRSLPFLPPLLLAILGMVCAASLMSKEATANCEAPLVAKYLKPLVNESDLIRLRRSSVSYPVRFYLWYYGVPHQKEEATPGVGKEFFVVKKSRYTIGDLTEKPVIELLDWGDIAIYQALPGEGSRAGQERGRPKEEGGGNLILR